MKNKNEMYYLVSILLMLISFILPISEDIYFIFGLLIFANIGWTIFRIIEYFKK